MSLEEKKLQLKAKLQVAAESKELKDSWLPFFLQLQEADVDFNIEYFICTTSPQYEHWLAEVENNWKQYGIMPQHVKNNNAHYVHDAVAEHYSNTNPLRYVPDIPNLSIHDEPSVLLNQLAAAIPVQPFYFFYTRYAPVLIVNSSLLVSPLMNELVPDLEDVCIVSTDMSVLIYKTLENEWYANIG